MACDQKMHIAGSLCYIHPPIEEEPDEEERKGTWRRSVPLSGSDTCSREDGCVQSNGIARPSHCVGGGSGGVACCCC